MPNFAETTSKGVWFFLPIGVLLTVNGWIFVGSIRAIRLADQRSVNPVSDGQRRERMERCFGQSFY
jgi:hypothetical protein